MDSITAVSTEFYNCTFAELIEAKGETRALEIVDNYLKISDKYKDCESWPIHGCKLLTTYKTPTDSLEPSRSLIDNLCSVYYNPVTNKSKSKDLSIRQVADLIKSDKFHAITRELRSISDTKLNRDFKQKRFCYTTFSGIFSYCSDDNIRKHSGVICLDADHLGESLADTKAIINNDPATVMSFVSPNGDGLKILYAMDPQAYSQQQYYQIYSNYICKITGLKPSKIDQSCKNVSRACFLPCDPEIFINPYFTAL